MLAGSTSEPALGCYVCFPPAFVCSCTRGHTLLAVVCCKGVAGAGSVVVVSGDENADRSYVILSAFNVVCHCMPCCCPSSLLAGRAVLSKYVQNIGLSHCFIADCFPQP